MSIFYKKKALFGSLLLGLMSVVNIQASIKQLPTLHEHQHHDTLPSNKQHSGLDISLSRASISHAGAISATDLIQKQAAVHLQAGSGNPNQSMISMDGFGNNESSNSVLLIDGIPISSFSNIGPNLNNVLIHNIDQLHIQTGSQGVLYGNQAVSGVVNIQTHQPLKPILIADLGVGNLQQMVTGLYASNRPNKHWGYNIGAQTYFNDHSRANSQQHNTTLNVNVHHFSANNHSTVNLISYDNSAEVPQALIWGENRAVGQPQTFHMKGNIFYVTNQHLMANQILMDSRLAFYQTSLKTSLMSAFIKQQGVFFSNHWHDKQWLFGLDDRYNNFDAHIGSNINHAAGNIVSGFGRYDWQLSHRWSAILGLRYAQQNIQAYGAVVPALNQDNNAWANEQVLTYQINHHVWASLSQHQSYAFANGKDQIWRLPGEKTYQPLQTQTGHQYNFDMHWQSQVDKAKLSIYQIDLKHEMVIDFINGMSEMKNLPPTRRRGIGFDNQWRLKPNWQLLTQFSYVDPRIVSGSDRGRMIPGVSAWNGLLGVQFQGHNHWLLQLTESFHGPFYAAFDLKNQGSMMPGYALTNIHLQKRDRRLTYDLSINNLFDHRYVGFASYRANYNNIAYYPADGISILGRISVNLVPNQNT